MVVLDFDLVTQVLGLGLDTSSPCYIKSLSSMMVLDLSLVTQVIGLGLGLRPLNVGQTYSVIGFRQVFTYSRENSS